MVQIDPGPTPTLIASAPAATRFLAPVAVATFPATTSIFGKSFFSNLTASTTPLESPCALSSTKTSTPASTSNLARCCKSFDTPTAPPTIKRPSESREARG